MRGLIVLHVEDCPDEALLLSRACAAANLSAEFHNVTGGSEAVAYLNGEGRYADRAENPLPNLIILDLKLQGMSGLDFLKWLRRDSLHAYLPVLVFTVSTEEKDRQEAMEAGATGYYVKPVDFPALVKLAEGFSRFGNIRGN